MNRLLLFFVCSCLVSSCVNAMFGVSMVRFTYATALYNSSAGLKGKKGGKSCFPKLKQQKEYSKDRDLKRLKQDIQTEIKSDVEK